MRPKAKTKYFEQRALPIGDHAAIAEGQYYYYDTQCYVKLPQWAWKTLCGSHDLTHVYGQYNFYNGVEETAEAQYLINMAQYLTLSPRAQQKVDAILNNYGSVISINDYVGVIEKWKSLLKSGSG